LGIDVVKITCCICCGWWTGRRHTHSHQRKKLCFWTVTNWYDRDHFR